MLRAFLKFTGLSKLAGLLAAAGVFAAGIGLAMLKAFSAGRRKEQVKTMEKIHEKAGDADKVRRDIRTDPSKRERLRKFDRNR